MTEERFDLRKNQLWLGKLSNSVLSHALPLIKDKEVLDAGFGSAWAEKKMLSAGALNIDAFDICEEMVKYGNSLNLDKVNFGVKDFNNEDFGTNKYDVAISMEVIEHLTNGEFYFKNLVKSLKPYGVLFLSTPNKKLSDGKNKFHVKEYNSQEIRYLFSKYRLEIVEFIGIKIGLSSKFSGKYLPRGLLEMIKKTPVYSFLVKHFVGFPTEKNVEKSESIIYIGRKMP